MNSTRAAIIACFASVTAWGLLAATASSLALAQSRDNPGYATQRDTREVRDRYYEEDRRAYEQARRSSPDRRPSPPRDHAHAPGDGHDHGPALRSPAAGNAKPSSQQDWRPRGSAEQPKRDDRRAEAPRRTNPAPSRDEVRKTAYQDEAPRKATTEPREESYDWHPGRDQAPRVKPTAQTEAPAYRPSDARSSATSPDDRRAMAPPPEYRERDYRETDRVMDADRRPARDRAGEPIFMTQKPRPRGAYRPTSASNTYELPAGKAPFQPEAEVIQGAPGQGNSFSSNGRPVYDGRPSFDGGGEYEVDENGYPIDGYGYGDDYNGGGYSHSSECYYDCCGPCEYCSTCCGGPSCPHRWFEEAAVFAGVHSFKGGLDQGQNGNFGFQEGVSTAGSLWHQYGIGYQVGGMFTQSNLSGSNVRGALDNSRQQSFVTAGLFRRAYCNHGFQGGAVYDWLDDRYYTRSRFSQIRAEASYLWGNGHEFGFWGAFATGHDETETVNGNQVQFTGTSLYSFFYRKTVASGGQARLWGGFTDDKGGLFGADYRIPMSNRWDFIGGFNYAIPRNGVNAGGYQQEAWGISMNIVWYPTRRACGTHNGPFRQLFGVADNNVFMVHQK